MPYTDYHDHADNVMQYLGYACAVSDLASKYLDSKLDMQWQFHLGYMTASHLLETYGDIFYLGEELSEIDCCPYDYHGRGDGYNAFYEKLYWNVTDDKFGRIPYEQQEEVRNSISEELNCEIKRRKSKGFSGGFFDLEMK